MEINWEKRCKKCPCFNLLIFYFLNIQCKSIRYQINIKTVKQFIIRIIRIKLALSLNLFDKVSIQKNFCIFFIKFGEIINNG